jgi:hypothetical protein
LAQRRAQDRHDDSRRQSRIGSTQVQRARTAANRPSPRPSPTDEEELTMEEAQAAFEAPYDNQQPRSQMSLARAATVAAVSPANRRHLRALPFRPLEYRRADGMREFPHESDADNWVPPPPAYTATAAASESVSLSHPNAPPVPKIPPGTLSNVPPQVRRMPVGASSNAPTLPRLPTSASSSSSSPGPSMSATVNPAQLSPSAPYQHRQQSISSVNLSSPGSFSLPSPTSERRPSLLHPSTYPSTQSSGSIRRRSSAAQSPPQLSYTASPQFQNPQQPPSAHANATRRATMRPRRAVESTVELRPPMMSPDTGRRGSAPNVVPARRQVGLFSSPTMDRMNAQPPPQNSPQTSPRPTRRGILPRLVPPESPSANGQRFPMSAPPRTDSLGPAAYAYPTQRPQGMSPPQQQQQMYVQPHVYSQSQTQIHVPSGRTSRMESVLSNGRMSRAGRDTPVPVPMSAPVAGAVAIEKQREKERKAGKRKIGCVVM